MVPGELEFLVLTVRLLPPLYGGGTTKENQFVMLVGSISNSMGCPDHSP